MSKLMPNTILCTSYFDKTKPSSNQELKIFLSIEYVFFQYLKIMLSQVSGII